MSTFQKPESALKRAEELLDVGRQQDALETLHAALTNKKNNRLWTSTIEQIMVKHLELCVELKRFRQAKDGLYQYRTMCQAANISSLELVVTKFRTAAEGKVQEAKKQQDLNTSRLADLEEMEPPQIILLKSIQANDTRQQSQDRDVHSHFRFLWDTYRVILDNILKNNSRLEEVYHETVRHAFNFCAENKRPGEFKKACEWVRKNYQDLQKHHGKVPPNQVNLANPDTIRRNLLTRRRQLEVATKLDMWREAYSTAQEIHELMQVAPPKTTNSIRSMYYDHLGQIFWKSDNHLYHAFACLKNLIFVKGAKQNPSEDELSLLSSKAVLATLCVPFQKEHDIRATLELTAEGEKSPYEKAKKHAALFNSQSVPTRETISLQLQEKDLLKLAIDPCRELFDRIESDFTPLTLCDDAKPYLEEIQTALDGQLAQYVTPLKQIIFFRLMKQLSEVYCSMTIEHFERAASVVPFSIAEKWMANASRQQGINIQINYRQQAIVFGAPQKVDMRSMRQPLIEIGFKLQQALNRVAPKEQVKAEVSQKEEIYKDLKDRISSETQKFRARSELIEKRREEQEKKRIAEEKEAERQRKEQERKEKQEEEARLAHERKRRIEEREKAVQKEKEMQEQQEILNQMIAATQKNPTKVQIAGKKLTEIEKDDLQTISAEEMKRALSMTVAREKQEKIRQRKLEAKRVDHLARALREEERTLLEDWAETVDIEDGKFLEKAESRDKEEQMAVHLESLKERDLLRPFREAKDDWVRNKLDNRWGEFEDAKRAQEDRLILKVAQNKIKRARERMQKDQEQEARRSAEDKKQREEEERRRRAERARQEEEAQIEAQNKAKQDRERQREEQEQQARRSAEEKKQREEEERRNRAERAKQEEEDGAGWSTATAGKKRGGKKA